MEILLVLAKVMIGFVILGYVFYGLYLLVTNKL